MKTQFTNCGVRYSLIVTPAGKDEPLVEANASGAASVWANQRQKHKLTGGLDDSHRDNPKPAGAVEGNKKPRIPWSKAVPAEHFLESAPLD